MSRSNFRTIFVVSISLATTAFVLAVVPLVASADEPTGLTAAAAMEEMLVNAIAQAEKSVVAIARVNLSEGADARMDARQDLFGQFRMNPTPRPGQPDFIPNEYSTGVVVDGSGLILTAYHTLRDGSEYYVTTADRKFQQARVVAADPRSDLAVLSIRVPNASPLTPIRFGDATKLKKGQIVIALGNPYALARDGQVSASWGIVANIARKDGPVPDAEAPTGRKLALHQYGTLIQTDAKLNLGTSGGALVNLKGEMVGLTVSLSAVLGYEQAAGFAIPVDQTFRRALEALKEGREVEYGFLGVALAPGNNPNEPGVRVSEVLPGTPAHRVGLQMGDLLTHVADQEIHDSDDLMLNIGKLPADGRVQLMVYRESDGRHFPLQVDLAKYWVPGKKIVTKLPPAWRGIRVDYVTASRDLRLWALQGRVDLEGSVLITEVEQDSPAWKEGLRPDMMISHIGNKRVSNPKDFYEAVTDKSGPVPVRLRVPANDRPVRTISPEAG